MDLEHPKCKAVPGGEACPSWAAKLWALLVQLLAPRTKQLPCPGGRHGCFLPSSLSLLIAVVKSHTHIHTSEHRPREKLPHSPSPRGTSASWALRTFLADPYSRSGICIKAVSTSRIFSRSCSLLWQAVIRLWALQKWQAGCLLAVWAACNGLDKSKAFRLV